MSVLSVLSICYLLVTRFLKLYFVTMAMSMGTDTDWESPVLCFLNSFKISASLFLDSMLSVLFLYPQQGGHRYNFYITCSGIRSPLRVGRGQGADEPRASAVQAGVIRFQILQEVHRAHIWVVKALL